MLRKRCRKDGRKGERMALERDGLFYLSKTVEWHTPGRYIRLARNVMGGIDLDPCGSALSNLVVGATRFYDKDQDGLTKRWEGRIWMNPPYSKATKLFVNKLLVEHRFGHIEQAIVLLCVNTLDRSWFWPLWDHSLCFHYGRVKFDTPDPSIEASSPPLGHVFVYIGKESAAFVREFSQVGACVAKCREMF